jgi:hypothetical protein
MSPSEDAMAWVRAFLRADEAMAVMAALNEDAKSADASDDRSMDIRRADAFVDAITRRPDTTDDDSSDPSDASPAATCPCDSDVDDGGETAPERSSGGGAPAAQSRRTGRGPAGVDGRVGSAYRRVDLRVIVGAGTLLGLDDKPGYLAGYGWIPGDLTRALAADATWRRLLTDPDTSKLLDLGRDRYRPPALLREFVETRDVTCRAPGCRRAAHRCDKDHAIPFSEGGCTCRANLQCLCLFHHRMKTHSKWDVKLDPDGTCTWTTPTGRVFVTQSPPVGDIGEPTRNEPHVRPRRTIYQDEHDDPANAPQPPKPIPSSEEPPF